MMTNREIKKICVYGVGGVGGFFGAKIVEAIRGRETANVQSYFIARGEHLKAIQGKGIVVNTPDQTIVGKPTIATDDVSTIPDPDLFLLCVKSYSLDEVVEAIKPKVGPQTVIMPLLNGADIYERIRANLDHGIVLPACVFVGTHIDSPGVISTSGGDGKILFGKDPAFPDFESDHVTRFFDDMGINYQYRDDAYPGIWGKYLFIASFGLVTVFTGKTLGEIMDDKKSKDLVLGIMGEIKAIASAKGIDLPATIINESINKVNNFPYETKTSYQRDVESKGSVNEGDLYGGSITREGKSLGIPTPVTESVYSSIQSRFSE